MVLTKQNGFRQGPEGALLFWAFTPLTAEGLKCLGGEAGLLGGGGWGKRKGGGLFRTAAAVHCMVLVYHHINYIHKDLKIYIGET